VSAGENPSAALTRLVNGYQVSHAIHAAAVLGIADLLATGARGAAELAVATGTDAGALYRLLRALAAVECSRSGRTLGHAGGAAVCAAGLGGIAA
jgi:hypothetical protein